MDYGYKKMGFILLKRTRIEYLQERKTKRTQNKWQLGAISKEIINKNLHDNTLTVSDHTKE